MKDKNHLFCTTDYKSIIEAMNGISTRILIDSALLHGITVEIIDPIKNIIRLHQNDIEHVFVKASLTSLTPSTSAEIARNKNATKRILSEHGFLVPEGYQVSTIEEAILNYNKLSDKNLVIKPNGTNNGIGISFVKANNLEDFKTAINDSLSEDISVLVETHCPGEEYRFLVIGNEVSSIVHRKAAHVVGNGVDTITELIKKKNQVRAAMEYALIQMGETEKDLLQENNLSFKSIPEKGMIIPLRHTSNIGTGGDAIEVSDQIHEYYKNIAIKAAQLFKIPICGLDLLLPKPKKEGSYTILELNDTPGWEMHVNPMSGQSVNIGKKLLNIVGFNTCEGSQNIRAAS
jgi:glutamate--cysteine ligase